MAQTIDVDHDGVFVDDGLAPDQVIEHILGEDAVDVVDEELHHGVFFGGQENLPTVFIEPQGAGVVLEGTGGDDAVHAG